MALELTATQALGLWHGVTLEQVQHDGPDLTMRQLAILLGIYLYRPRTPCAGLPPP